MRDFNYYAPTEVVFGAESEEQVATLVRKYGGSKVAQALLGKGLFQISLHKKNDA